MVPPFFMHLTERRTYSPQLKPPKTVAILPNAGCISSKCLLHFGKTPTLLVSDRGSIPKSTSLLSSPPLLLLIIYKATLDKKQEMVNDITFVRYHKNIESMKHILFTLALASVAGMVDRTEQSSHVTSGVKP